MKYWMTGISQPKLVNVFLISFSPSSFLCLFICIIFISSVLFVAARIEWFVHNRKWDSGKKQKRKWSGEIETRGNWWISCWFSLPVSLWLLVSLHHAHTKRKTFSVKWDEQTHENCHNNDDFDTDIFVNSMSNNSKSMRKHSFLFIFHFILFSVVLSLHECLQIDEWKKIGYRKTSEK